MKLKNMIQDGAIFRNSTYGKCFFLNISYTTSFINDDLFDFRIYVELAFEPHNVMTHVTQNLINFCMAAIFWISGTAIYHRVMNLYSQL